MDIEDAREFTFAAAKKLETNREKLGEPHLRIWTVAEFLSHAAEHKMPQEDKETIADQAILLVDQLYAHLPFKQARYAIDPVQRLRLIRAQVSEFDDLEFHREMLRAFVKLRDAHTFYGLPAPYQGASAFLPFRLEVFHDDEGRRRFLVTQVMDGFSHEQFRRETEVLTWNGMPVEQAVEVESLNDPGGNEAARFARALNRMTARSLTFALPSEEQWVLIEYAAPGSEESRGIVLPWVISTRNPEEAEHTGVAEPRAGSGSVNGPLVEISRTCNMLWGAKAYAQEQDPMGGADGEPPAIDFDVESKLPKIFAFQHSGGVKREGAVDPAALNDPKDPEKTKRFGSIRIKTFEIDDADEFVAEFARIVDLMRERAPDGLIIDARGNPGGNIQAAERILQLLTPNEIQPAQFHFINTVTTQRIATDVESLVNRVAGSRVVRGLGEWKPWIDDLKASLSSGKTITSGRALTDFNEANVLGQHYHGPVALIVSATSYSATDIFAAGFQDNGVGQIIGVDENTGGGGANRWLHDEIMSKLDGETSVALARLPRGASFGVAIRRSTRVKANAGVALEDTGVQVMHGNKAGADKVFRLTRADLVDRNRDLLSRACGELARRPGYTLNPVRVEPGSDHVRVEVETANLDRLEFFLDERPQVGIPVVRGTQVVEVPLAGLHRQPLVLKILGHSRRRAGDPDSRMVLTAAAKRLLVWPEASA